MEDLVAVGVYASAREGLERCLVILAMGFPCWLTPDGEGHSLMVEAVHAEQARTQLSWFERENENWPPPPPPLAAAVKRGLFVTPLLWALTVTAVFWFQNQHPGRWEATGALDGRAVFEAGEWWRPVTALFLHGDAGHFLSNLVAGVFIFAAALSVLGVSRGWLLLGAAGIGGNVIVAELHRRAGDVSLGASTAIFGAVGLLAGRAVRAAARHAGGKDLKAVGVPLAVGIIVLGLYGAGGVDVDVAAHLAGFGCGLGLGIVVGEEAECRLQSDGSP